MRIQVLITCFFLLLQTIAFAKVDVIENSQGLPVAAGLTLSNDTFVPVNVAKIKNARMLWLNRQYLVDNGYLESEINEKLESTLVEAFAYASPSENDAKNGYDFADQKTFYADRYGGDRTNGNLGSGRAAGIGSFQIKGVKTPLATHKGNDHSNGLMELEVALSEAIWSEKSQELPFGGNRVVAIIDRGFNFFDSHNNLQRAVLVVRESSLRPAHFMSSWHSSFSKDIVEKERLRAYFNQKKFLEQALPQPTVSTGKGRIYDGLLEYIRRVSVQFAAMYVRRIHHGSISQSNIEISGKLIDYATQTTQKGYGKVYVKDAFGDFSRIYSMLISTFLMDLRNNQKIADQIPDNNEAYSQFTLQTNQALILEILMLVGFSESESRQISQSDAAAAFSTKVAQILSKGSVLYSAKEPLPEKTQDYDISDIFKALHSSNMDLLLKALAGETHLANELFFLFQNLIEQSVKILSVEDLDLFLKNLSQMSVDRNRYTPELYRYNLIANNIRVADSFLKNGDPRGISDYINFTIRFAKAPYKSLSPNSCLSIIDRN